MEEIVINQTKNVKIRIFSKVTHPNKVGIIILPGGGYEFCSERESDPVAIKFNEMGFPAVVIHYSVGPFKSVEGAIKDINSTIDLIEQHPEWGMDKERLVLVGFSAGGHLAAAYANMQPKVSVLSEILVYPCILDSMNKLLGSNTPSLDQLVTETTPKSFVVGTFSDELVPVENALAYMKALDQNKIPFEGHIFQEGHHGLSLGIAETSFGEEKQIDSHYAHWFDLSIEWLNKNLEDFK
ncbi:hypothetical protein IGI37_003317 [Enterococcus sp. AZ194]|uniref:alpha/beta hydrolase n=1 Tax=Enterococcus sp. AZ194 TaxID=2774629 RepID=UPI003F215544